MQGGDVSVAYLNVHVLEVLETFKYKNSFLWMERMQEEVKEMDGGGNACEQIFSLPIL